MGSTKIKPIEETTEVKEIKPAKKGRRDSLVESLRQEMGIEDQSSDLSAQSADSKKIVRQSTGQQKTGKPKSDTRQLKTDNKKIRSRKYQESVADLDKNQTFMLDEAIEKAQKSSFTSFLGTLEIHINTNQKNVRGLITLPHAAGKKLKVLAFGKEALNSGADLIGDDDKLKEIAKGKIDFDVLVSDTSWMPKIVPLAKVLGPRGLMPNPKNGTISDNLQKTVAELQGGKVEYKTEPNGKVIHMSIGKVNQPVSEINANIKTLFMAIGKSRIKKITLASTMGPGVKINLSSV